MQRDFDNYGGVMSRTFPHALMNKDKVPKAISNLWSKAEKFKPLLDLEADACPDRVMRAQELIGREGWPSAGVLQQVAQLLAVSHLHGNKNLWHDL